MKLQKHEEQLIYLRQKRLGAERNTEVQQNRKKGGLEQPKKIAIVIQRFKSMDY
jgi:hypothetical protein